MIIAFVFKKWVNLDVLAVATLKYWKPTPNHPGNAPFGTYFEKCFPKTQNQIMTARVRKHRNQGFWPVNPILPNHDCLMFMLKVTRVRMEKEHVATRTLMPRKKLQQHLLLPPHVIVTWFFSLLLTFYELHRIVPLDEYTQSYQIHFVMFWLTRNS